mmetsp:Transcript_19760/g.56735  ORF Transcript_19760/g.56735 Transcript_19760/m.56735 type:complete len:367 (+) Transcript_19760:1718-2818(+)
MKERADDKCGHNATASTRKRKNARRRQSVCLSVCPIPRRSISQTTSLPLIKMARPPPPHASSLTTFRLPSPAVAVPVAGAGAGAAAAAWLSSRTPMPSSTSSASSASSYSSSSLAPPLPLPLAVACVYTPPFIAAPDAPVAIPSPPPSCAFLLSGREDDRSPPSSTLMVGACGGLAARISAVERSATAGELIGAEGAPWFRRGVTSLELPVAPPPQDPLMPGREWKRPRLTPRNPPPLTDASSSCRWPVSALSRPISPPPDRFVESRCLLSPPDPPPPPPPSGRRPGDPPGGPGGPQERSSPPPPLLPPGGWGGLPLSGLLDGELLDEPEPPRRGVGSLRIGKVMKLEKLTRQRGQRSCRSDRRQQ